MDVMQEVLAHQMLNFSIALLTTVFHGLCLVFQVLLCDGIIQKPESNVPAPLATASQFIIVII
jgi:hypothetical protein